MRVNLLILSVVVIMSIEVYGSEEHEETRESLENQILNIEKQTKEIRKKIEHVLKKAKADSANYGEYISDYKKHSTGLKNERDSLRAMAATLSERRDSLYEHANMILLKSENVRKQSNQIQNLVRKNCLELIDSLIPMKVFNIDKQISALRFLEGEMNSGTVSSVEGLERYWQIVAQIEEASQKIESWTGTAPEKTIKGEVTFLRLGFVWLACINKDNTCGFVWDIEKRKWEPVQNNESLRNIDIAVKLSAGKTAPELVALPFNVKFNIIKAEEKQ